MAESTDEHLSHESVFGHVWRYSVKIGDDKVYKTKENCYNHIISYSEEKRDNYGTNYFL